MTSRRRRGCAPTTGPVRRTSTKPSAAATRCPSRPVLKTGEVKGIVFVDVLTPELRAQMTPEEWKIWKRINARPAKALAAYPDLERQDFDETLDQTAAAPALRPMPVVVLTASDKFIDVVPKLIQAGELPPDTPADDLGIWMRALVGRQNSRWLSSH